jgi:hypothetical protein
LRLIDECTGAAGDDDPDLDVIPTDVADKDGHRRPAFLERQISRRRFLGRPRRGVRHCWPAASGRRPGEETQPRRARPGSRPRSPSPGAHGLGRAHEPRAHDGYLRRIQSLNPPSTRSSRRTRRPWVSPQRATESDTRGTSRAATVASPDPAQGHARGRRGHPRQSASNPAVVRGPPHGSCSSTARALATRCRNDEALIAGASNERHSAGTLSIVALSVRPASHHAS